MDLPVRIKPLHFLLFTFAVSTLMHLHVFKRDLVGYHVWRQTQTQITIQNYAHTDFNILNPRSNDTESGTDILRQEFPLMQWGFAGFYKLFGDHLIITRILSFLIGLFSVAGMYFLLTGLFRNNLIACIGAWAFNFSPVFYYYTMNPLPDNLALCFSIAGLGFFIRWVNSPSASALLPAGIFLSLSALVKLPFVLYFVFPFIYLFASRKKAKTGILLAAFLIPAALWYGMALPSMQSNPVVAGLFGEEGISFSEALDILWFNLISTLPELLVNYSACLFFLAGFYFLFRNKTQPRPLFFSFTGLAAALLLYFIYEMNLIAKVHDYYLFPFLPLIFITVAYGCFRLMGSGKTGTRIAWVLLCILPVTAFLRADSRWDTEDPGFNKDFLIYKEELRRAIPPSESCLAGNDRSKNIFFYYIDKKGWAFDGDSLSVQKLEAALQAGVTHLYSDSRAVDENDAIRPYLDSLLLEKGSIRVFRLKRATN